jgi:hypothetical protein
MGMYKCKRTECLSRIEISRDIDNDCVGKKYELIPSDKEGLYRIKALRNFGDVKKGEIGGYVSGEHNLSHSGLCWIYDDAKVYDDALVSANAKVYDNARLYDKAVVCENAEVCGSAWVYGSATIDGNAVVCGDAEVHGDAHVYDTAIIDGFADIDGNVVVCGDAVIKKDCDYQVYKNSWSSGRYFIWTRSNNMWKVGCFYGTGEELIKKAYKDSKLSGKMYELHVNLVKEMLKSEKELAESE